MRSPLRVVSFFLGFAVLGVVSPAAADATHACVEAAHEGQRLRDGGKLTSAREAFVRCSAASCPAAVRDSCEGWIVDLDARTPTIVLGARDSAQHDLAQVRVTLDGREIARTLDGRALAVDPGPHELAFEAEGFVTKRESVVVREGERLRSVVVSMDRSAPRPAAVETRVQTARDSTPLVISGAVGVVGLVGFGVFGLWGQSQKSDLEGSCAATSTCAPGDVDGARTKLIVADVSLVVGLVGAAVLGVLLLSPAPRNVARY